MALSATGVTIYGLVQMSYLVHHGIKGQKWGVRRFQNEDGSLTPAGKKRYSEYKDLVSSDRYKKQIDKIETETLAGARKIFDRRDAELEPLDEKFDRDSKNVKSANEYDALYEQYRKKKLKILDKYSKELRNSEFSFSKKMEKFRDVAVSELGFDDIDEGRDVVKLFEKLDFDEEYRRYRGPDY